MKTDLFDFNLPKELIAQKPVSPRDTAKMLVVEQSAFQHLHVYDLPNILQDGDLLVFNDTKVVPSRLIGKKHSGGKVEITLHKRNINANDNESIWHGFAKGSKKLTIGDSLYFNEDEHMVEARIINKFARGEIALSFPFSEAEMLFWLENYATLPLPPYIRKGIAQEEDKKDYQTIYAKHQGAVAAPTAGLHFTENLFAKLKDKNIDTTYITLHVGAGTFLPVNADDIKEHEMHSEWGEISEESAKKINDAKKQGRRVIAVGTTSLRLLESAVNENGLLEAKSFETNIFIYPGFNFKVIDALVTNFHLPRSTLFMLVSAVAGLAKMQATYREAVLQNYRFYSYGDCCFIPLIK